MISSRISLGESHSLLVAKTPRELRGGCADGCTGARDGESMRFRDDEATCRPLRCRTRGERARVGAPSRRRDVGGRESYTHVRCRILPRRGRLCRHLSSLPGSRLVLFRVEFGNRRHHCRSLLVSRRRVRTRFERVDRSVIRSQNRDAPCPMDRATVHGHFDALLHVNSENLAQPLHCRRQRERPTVGSRFSSSHGQSG
jgi:hypothetical protein